MKCGSRFAALAASLVAMAVLTGCQSQGLTRQGLVSEGDAICKRTSEQLNPLFTKLFPTGEETPPASEAAAAMRDAAKLVREETESLGSLKPQKELQDDFRPIVEGLKEASGLLDESARLAAQGDTEGYLEKLQEANRADQDTRDLMVEFGFEDCGGAPPD